MPRKTRRSVIKLGSTVTGVGAVSSIGAAKSNERSPEYDGNVRVVEYTPIAESDERSASGIVVKDGNDFRYYITEHYDTRSKVSVAEVDRSTYESMTAEVGTMSVGTVEQRVSAMGGSDDIIERFDTWEGTNGSCSAYNYTHRQVRYSAEVVDELDEIAAPALAAALSQAISVSALTGGAAILAGAIGVGVITGAAVLTGDDTFTAGAIEFDEGFWTWTQTSYTTKVGSGWNVGMGNLIPMSGALGHPGRA